MYETFLYKYCFADQGTHCDFNTIFLSYIANKIAYIWVLESMNIKCFELRGGRGIYIMTKT